MQWRWHHPSINLVKAMIAKTETKEINSYRQTLWNLLFKISGWLIASDWKHCEYTSCIFSGSDVKAVYLCTLCPLVNLLAIATYILFLVLKHSLVLHILMLAISQCIMLIQVVYEVSVELHERFCRTTESMLIPALLLITVPTSTYVLRVTISRSKHNAPPPVHNMGCSRFVHKVSPSETFSTTTDTVEIINFEVQFLLLSFN